MNRCLLITIAMLAGCAEVDPELATTSAAIEIPAVQDWKLELGHPAVLFPEDIDHLHTLIVRGDRPDTMLAWGVGRARVLWRFRLSPSDDETFTLALHDAWLEREAVAGKTHTIAGSVRSPGPTPPTPPGEPELARIVLSSAQFFEVETRAVLDSVAGM